MRVFQYPGRMRTLLVAPVLHSLHGGIPRILRLYERALAEMDGANGRLDVLVLNDVMADAPKQPVANGEFVGCARSKLKFARNLFRMGGSADRIVCGHVHLAPLIWLLKIFRPRVRVYFVGHGIEVWRRMSWAERRGLRVATGVLCVSEFSRRELLRLNPELAAARVVVVPNAIDDGFVGAAEAGGEGEREVKANEDRRAKGPVVLTVSRLTTVDREKGVEAVIAAMPAVRKEFPGAVLRVVGTGDDLERLRASAGGEGVVFLGAVEDSALRREYAACDVFVLPSRKEGFGLVYLEAMAFGKPCVAADAGGAPEVVSAEVGRVVPYGDGGSLAAAICDVWRNPPDPARVRAQAEKFSYRAFRAKLAEALAETER